MDAGRVVFSPGSSLDVSKAMGFRNEDTYCVAPVASGSVQGHAPLASYDFWAVGKNCCSGSAGDFRCGWYDAKRARGGVRMVRDEDRAFYRLAVQQAQSTFQIKSVHPLFFHWVEDPNAEIERDRLNGYRFVLIGMFGFFGFQMTLVTFFALFLSRKKFMI